MKAFNDYEKLSDTELDCVNGGGAGKIDKGVMPAASLNGLEVAEQHANCHANLPGGSGVIKCEVLIQDLDLLDDSNAYQQL